MSRVDSAVDRLLDHEGGAFVPQDQKRGCSRYGITLATWQETHPGAVGADIRALTREQAASYYTQWYQRYGFGQLEETVACQVFDTSVNVGARTAIKLLQQALGQRDDGVLGPLTAAAANVDPAGSVRAFRMRAERYYRQLGASHPERYTPALVAAWVERLWCPGL